MDDYIRLNPKSKTTMYVGNTIKFCGIVILMMMLSHLGVTELFSELFDFSEEGIRAVAYVSLALFTLYLILAPQIFYIRYRYMVDEERIDIRWGIFFIRRTVVPIERIHQIEVRIGPIKSMFDLANVRVTTAGGTASIEYLENDKAEEIADRLIGMVNRIMKEARDEPE